MPGQKRIPISDGGFTPGVRFGVGTLHDSIGLFLRHEMNRKRPDDMDEARDIPAVPPISGQSQLANNEASPRTSADEDDEL